MNFGFDIPSWCEVSHVYNMAEFFAALGRRYEVCVRAWHTLEDGTKVLCHGKASSNDLQVAANDAVHALRDKIANAQADHAKHRAQVAKLQAARPPEPPRPSVSTLTLDDLDL
jgi:hypothetical protein